LLVRRHRGRGLTRFAVRYLGLFTLAAVLLVAIPGTAILGFLILSAIHFGRADAEFDLPASAGNQARRLWALSRGLLVIGLPLAVSPLQAWDPFARLVSLLGGDAPLSAGFLRALGLAATVIAISAGTACALRKAGERPLRRAWFESAALLLLLVLTHPLFAVGVYFLAVHAFRQSVDLGAKLSPAGNRASLGRRLFRTHLASLPLLVPSWLIFAAAAFLLAVRTPYELAVLSLGLYVIGTLPHHWLHSDAEAR
jgi:Brp/Blh family beta-carotene 15,15'-monooxygenase